MLQKHKYHHMSLKTFVFFLLIGNVFTHQVEFLQNEDLLHIAELEAKVKRQAAGESDGSGLPEDTTTVLPPTTAARTDWYSGSYDNSVLIDVFDGGYTHDLDRQKISFSNGQYDSITIFKNGIVTLGDSGAVYSRSATNQNLNGIRFPLLSPFNTDFEFDGQSDVTVGVYNKNQLNENPALKNNIVADVEYYLTSGSLQEKKRKRRDGDDSEFSPDNVIIVTYKNVKPSPDSNERATFQVAIVQSFATEKTYTIYNYDRNSFTWDCENEIVYIGFTDGNDPLVGGISMYANTENTDVDPCDIFDATGNLAQLGRFIYDNSYEIADECEAWFLDASSNTKTALELGDAFASQNYLACPFTMRQAEEHPAFFETIEDSWKSNTKCYSLHSIYTSRYPQHVCCYKIGKGNLQNSDENAGFLYYASDEESLKKGGQKCCDGRGWDGCQYLYDVFPLNTDDSYVAPAIAFTYGDPQFTTFDGREYIFNGYGEYIFMKTNDNAFQIQGKTDYFINVKNPTIMGTFWISFAVKENNGPIVELCLNADDKLELYVNKIAQSGFVNNNVYDKSFPDTSSTVAVKQFDDYAMILYPSGVSIIISAKSTTNAGQKISWVTCNLYLDNKFVTQYRNSISGLLGNLNGDKNDDIGGRDGQTTSSSSEQEIYGVLETWKLSSSEETYFAASLSTRKKRQTVAFNPSFSDQIAVPHEVRTSCSNNTGCISDNLMTGVANVGSQTKVSSIAKAETLQVTNNKPPTIAFAQSPIRIDWSQLSAVSIVATVSDSDQGDTVTATVSVTNATTFTITNTAQTAVTSGTVTISYTPKRDDFPIIAISVVDSNSAAVVSTVNIEICDCKKLDSENECLYNTTLVQISPNVKVVKCKCSKYYTGDNCDKTIDYCGISQPCNPISSDYNISYTCSNFDVATQKATNKTYYCDGACPNLIGYTKDITGFCFDINECLSSTACPSNATCINSIGSFTCKCPAGTHYANNLCNDIDECATNSNDCEQLCQNTIGSYSCSCYAGYSLVNSTKCFYDPSIVIAGCDTKNCSQICTLDSSSNATVCKCNNGYGLDSDNATCADNNECALNTSGCSNTCVNTVGSFVCSCPTGQRLDIDRKTCIRCQSGTWGDNCNNTCNCVNAVRCDSALGCICLTGYTGTFCQTDINECLNAPTFSQSTCVNTPGSFSYVCNSGYQKSSNTSDNNCYDINECLTNSICPQNSECRNTVGSYECNCVSGYTYDNTTKGCLDINECTSNASSNVCPNQTFCVNLGGDYRCDCNDGYEKSNATTNDKSPICLDINECQLSTPVCQSNETCVNSAGSFQCNCASGYSRNGTTCSDINECTQNSTNPCGGLSDCTNTQGSYTCTCRRNFSLVNGTCVYVQRNTKLIKFLMRFIRALILSLNRLGKRDSTELNCNTTASQLANISSLVVDLYKQQQNLTTNVTTTIDSCVNGTAVLAISVQFSESLTPVQETTAVLKILNLGINYDSVKLVTDTNSITINETNKCLVYDQYEICSNGGTCYINNGLPACLCLSNAQYTYSGDNCQEARSISDATISSALKNTVPMSTLLISTIISAFYFVNGL